MSDLSRTLQEGTVIQSLILSKTRFKSLESARQWISDNKFRQDKIDETEESYRFRQREPDEFDENGFGEGEKFRTIELTNGVKATIGYLIESEKEEKKTAPELEGISIEGIQFSYSLENVTLQDDNRSTWVDVMTTINRHFHEWFGEITITKNDLVKYMENFESGIPSLELPIDYFHMNLKEAAGWIKKLRLSKDGNTLQGLIEFTKKAAEKIRDKEIRFFSPEFIEIHKTKKGEIIRNVLFGGGLTNRPFLDMGEIQLSSVKLSEKLSIGVKAKTKKGDDNNMDVTKLTEQIKALSEEKEKISNQVKELSAKFEETVTAYKNENKELSEKVEKMKSEKESQDFESAFSKLLTEGKVIISKKEELKKRFSGAELTEFYSDMPVILSTVAVGSTGSADSKQLSAAEQALVDAGEYTADEIIKYRKIKEA